MRQMGFALVGLLGFAGWSAAQPPETINLRVLYVGSTSTPRGKAYHQLLRQHFQQADAIDRKGFTPAQADKFDVVLLDWSQSDRQGRPEKPALGARDAWSKPTVLLGSAGLLLAEGWQIHGAIG